MALTDIITDSFIYNRINHSIMDILGNMLTLLSSLYNEATTASRKGLAGSPTAILQLTCVKLSAAKGDIKCTEGSDSRISLQPSELNL